MEHSMTAGSWTGNSSARRRRRECDGLPGPTPRPTAEPKGGGVSDLASPQCGRAEHLMRCCPSQLWVMAEQWLGRHLPLPVPGKIMSPVWNEGNVSLCVLGEAQRFYATSLLAPIQTEPRPSLSSPQSLFCRDEPSYPYFLDPSLRQVRPWWLLVQLISLRKEALRYSEIGNQNSLLPGGFDLFKTFPVFLHSRIKYNQHSNLNISRIALPLMQVTILWKSHSLLHLSRKNSKNYRFLNDICNIMGSNSTIYTTYLLANL